MYPASAANTPLMNKSVLLAAAQNESMQLHNFILTETWYLQRAALDGSWKKKKNGCHRGRSTVDLSGPAAASGQCRAARARISDTLMPWKGALWGTLKHLPDIWPASPRDGTEGWMASPELSLTTTDDCVGSRTRLCVVGREAFYPTVETVSTQTQQLKLTLANEAHI